MKRNSNSPLRKPRPGDQNATCRKRLETTSFLTGKQFEEGFKHIKKAIRTAGKLVQESTGKKTYVYGD